MKAEVPYLARLARQAAGQAMLWPPRQLFTGDIDMPARLPDRGGSPRRRPSPRPRAFLGRWRPPPPAKNGRAEAIAAAHGVDTGEERWAGLEPGSAASAAPVRAAPMPPPSPGACPPLRAASRAGHPCHAGHLHRAGTAATPRHLGLAGTGSGHSGDARPPGHARAAAGCAAPASRFITPGPPAAGPANSASARPVAPPDEPPAASSSPPAGGTGRARPPGSWASPLWGAPVDLPEALELAPVADEAARRAVSASPAGPATPPSGPGTAAPAGSRPGQRTDDAGTSVARGAAGHREPGAEARRCPGSATGAGAGPGPDAAARVTDSPGDDAWH